jgi:RNA polymerase sigma factor (sigma-70 family)
VPPVWAGDAYSRQRAKPSPVVDRPPDDLELSRRAAAGDLDAYTELVAMYEQLAFRVAFLVCGSAADAQEAAQDAFVKAYGALGRFRAGSSFRPWLLRIVGNEARNKRRAAGRRLHYESAVAAGAISGDAVPSPEMAIVARETNHRLLTAVNQLPDSQQMTIACRYFLDLDEAETGRVLGIPPGTVKSRTARGIARLRELMGND